MTCRGADLGDLDDPYLPTARDGEVGAERGNLLFALVAGHARQSALQLLLDHVLSDLDLVVRPGRLDGLDLVGQLKGPLLNRRHAHRGGPETGPTQA